MTGYRPELAQLLPAYAQSRNRHIPSGVGVAARAIDSTLQTMAMPQPREDYAAGAFSSFSAGMDRFVENIREQQRAVDTYVRRQVRPQVLQREVSRDELGLMYQLLGDERIIEQLEAEYNAIPSDQLGRRAGVRRNLDVLREMADTGPSGAGERLVSWGQSGIDLFTATADTLWDASRMVARGIGDPIPGVDQMTYDEIRSEFGENFSQGAQAVFGPDGLIGAPVNVLPQPGNRFGSVRSGGGAAISTVTNAAESGYRFASHTVATPFLAGALADAPGGGGVGGLFRGETWSEAWTMAREGTTAGQGLALMLFTDDITDPVEVGQVQSTSHFDVVSGGIDFTLAVVGDPSYLAARGFTVARARRYALPVDDINNITRSQINDIVNHPRMNEFLEFNAGRSFDEIMNVNGNILNPQQGWLLSTAANVDEARDVVRLMWGDPDASARVQTRLGLVDLQDAENTMIRGFSGGDTAGVGDELYRMNLAGLDGNPIFDDLTTDYMQRMDRIKEEMDRINYVVTEAGSNIRGGTGAVSGFTTAIPDTRKIRTSIYRFGHSETLANSPLRPVVAVSRRAMDRVMPQAISLEGNQAHMVNRLFNGTELDDATRRSLIADYVSAPGAQERKVALDRVREEVLADAYRRAPMPDEQARELVGRLNNERTEKLEAIAERFSTDAEMLVPNQNFDLALETMGENFWSTQDIAYARQVAGWQGHLMASFDSTLPRVRQLIAALDAINNTGKIGAVFSPRWMMRVLPEEGLRARVFFRNFARTAGYNRAQRRAFMRGLVRKGPRRGILEDRPNPRAQTARQHVEMPDGEVIDLPDVFAGAGGDVLASETSARGRVLSAFVDDLDSSVRQFNQRVDALKREVYAPADAGHVGAWTDWLNNHWGQSRASRRVLSDIVDGVSDDQIVARLVDWMENTREGRTFRRQFPERRSYSREGWAEEILAEARIYAPTDEIMQAALDRRVTREMLDSVPGDMRPTVNGPKLTELDPTNRPIARLFEGFVNFSARVLSDLPSDRLVRHPLSGAVTRLATDRNLRILRNQVDNFGVLRTSFTDLDGVPTRIAADRVMDNNRVFLGESADVGFYIDSDNVFRAGGDLAEDAWDEMLASGKNYDVVEYIAPDGRPVYMLADPDIAVNNLDDLTRISQRGEPLTPAQINLAQQRAREEGIASVRRALYDLSEQSELGAALRLIVPFYNAWEEVIVKWGRLAAQDPTILVRGAQLWNAPDRIGITSEDQFGNEVVTFRVPDVAKDLPLIGGVFDNPLLEEVQLDLTSLNTIVNWPSAGPLLTIPVAQFVKDDPYWREQLSWLYEFGFPDGPIPDPRDDVAFLRFLNDTGLDFGLIFGDRNPERQARNTIHAFQYLVYEEGRRLAQEDPTLYMSRDELNDLWKKAEEHAVWRDRFQGFMNFTFPARSNFANGPLQDIATRGRELRDEWNAEQERTGREPEWDWELRMWEEFDTNYVIALMQSATRNVSGYPTTIEGFEANNKYADLIEDYPEDSWTIIGLEGNGEFDPNVYDIVGRETRAMTEESKVELIHDVNIEAGWMEYNAIVDELNGEAKLRGGESYRDFEDLAFTRRLLVEGDPDFPGSEEESLRSRNPLWDENRNGFDPDRTRKWLDRAREWSADPRLNEEMDGEPVRPDIAGLRAYIELRDEFSAIVQENDYASLRDPEGMQPAEDAFDDAVTQILDEYPEFSSIYYRYLERDPVEAR